MPRVGGQKIFGERLTAGDRAFARPIRTGGCAVPHSSLGEQPDATDWFCLDCELLPWSAKAQELLRQQYTAVGSAASAALAEVAGTLGRAAARSTEVEPLRARYRQRAGLAGRYVDAYRRYCWPVRSVADLKLTPFHLLASEGAVHVNRGHAGGPAPVRRSLPRDRLWVHCYKRAPR